MAELLGMELTPAQRYIFDVALEVQTEAAGDPVPGEYAYDRVVVTKPRQSGKTYMAAPLVAMTLGGDERREAYLTAQTRMSAVARWKEAAEMLKLSPIGSSTKLNTGVGGEVLRWRANRSTFTPFPPTANAMHGAHPDLVIVDELWSFDWEQKSYIEQGYAPAGAVKQVQQWLMSTAGTEASEWLNWVTKLGRESVANGKQIGTAYFEWSVNAVVNGVSIDEAVDEDMLNAVIQCHPRHTRGLRLQYLRDELDSMGREDFLRAYGNWPSAKGGKTLFEMQQWRRAYSDTRIPRDVRVALAFETDNDGMEASVSAVWRDNHGVAYTELIDRRDGILWVPDELVRLVKAHRVGAVGMNNAGAARDVGAKVERAFDQAKIVTPVMKVNSGAWAAACSRFESELTAADPMIRHDGNPEVTEAMRNAGWRALGAGKALAKRGNEPITALASHTLAVWVFDEMPDEPARFRIA